MNVTIRNATTRDAAAIADVHVRTWQSAYRGLLPDHALDAMHPEQRRPMWDRLLSAPAGDHGVLIAEKDGSVIGFCSFGRMRGADATSGMFELFTIYVDPKAQGQGAGTALMLAAEAAMRDAGANEALLWVLDGNEQAQRFYRRHGWISSGTPKSETLFGNEIQELLYTRDLNSPRPPDIPASPS